MNNDAGKVFAIVAGLAALIFSLAYILVAVAGPAEQPLRQSTVRKVRAMNNSTAQPNRNVQQLVRIREDKTVQQTVSIMR